MIISRLNILAMAGTAKPNPKMGQALGPLGINMMMFCKDFNAKTAHINNDVPLRVVLHGKYMKLASFTRQQRWVNSDASCKFLGTFMSARSPPQK